MLLSDFSRIVSKIFRVYTPTMASAANAMVEAIEAADEQKETGLDTQYEKKCSDE